MPSLLGLGQMEAPSQGAQSWSSGWVAVTQPHELSPLLLERTAAGGLALGAEPQPKRGSELGGGRSNQHCTHRTKCNPSWVCSMGIYNLTPLGRSLDF